MYRRWFQPSATFGCIVLQDTRPEQLLVFGVNQTPNWYCQHKLTKQTAFICQKASALVKETDMWNLDGNLVFMGSLEIYRSHCQNTTEEGVFSKRCFRQGPYAHENCFELVSVEIDRVHICTESWWREIIRKQSVVIVGADLWRGQETAERTRGQMVRSVVLSQRNVNKCIFLQEKSAYDVQSWACQRSLLVAWILAFGKNFFEMCNCASFLNLTKVLWCTVPTKSELVSRGTDHRSSHPCAITVGFLFLSFRVQRPLHTPLCFDKRPFRAHFCFGTCTNMFPLSFFHDKFVTLSKVFWEIDLLCSAVLWLSRNCTDSAINFSSIQKNLKPRQKRNSQVWSFETKEN